jgi:hypothetical protein
MTMLLDQYHELQVIPIVYVRCIHIYIKPWTPTGDHGCDWI